MLYVDELKRGLRHGRTFARTLPRYVLMITFCFLADFIDGQCQVICTFMFIYCESMSMPILTKVVLLMCASIFMPPPEALCFWMCCVWCL